MNYRTLLIPLFCLTTLSSAGAQAGTDLRKDPENPKMASAAATYIVKEGAKAPKGASETALKELKKICTSTLHKGCYFWKKGDVIYFQPLNSSGEKNGVIYILPVWLKKLFS
jgi:hypothetical protein